MTLDQFVAKWLGKTADYDGYYGGQCVDLFRYYVAEVLHNLQPDKVVGAKEFWTNFDRDRALYNNFTKITNTLTAVPQKGDVVIWDAWTGNPFGHVAIFLEGNVMSFISLDQNYPTLSLVTKTRHNYLSPKVLGWLRPKEADDIMSLKDTVITWFDCENKKRTVGWYVDEWCGEKRDKERVQKELVEAGLQLIACKERAEGLTNDIEKLREDQQKVVEQLNNRIKKLELENYDLKQELDSCKKESLETLSLGDFVSWVGLKLGIKK